MAGRLLQDLPSRDRRHFSQYRHDQRSGQSPKAQSAVKTYFATDERTQPPPDRSEPPPLRPRTNAKFILCLFAAVVTTEKTNILLRQFHVQAESKVHDSPALRVCALSRRVAAAEGAREAFGAGIAGAREQAAAH